MSLESNFRVGRLPILLNLFFCILIGLVLGALLTLVISWGTGFSMDQLVESDTTTSSQRNMAKLVLIIHHLCTFVIPGLLAAYLLYKSKWYKFLKLSRSDRPLNFIYTLVIMICLPPLIAVLYWLNQQIALPFSLSEMEANTNQMITQLLVLDSPWDFIINLFVIAVIPALGEEFIFRGHLQQYFSDWMKNAHLGIWLAAFFFSAMHLQFEGFLPRLILGGILGYLFYFTGNLWIAIWAHFLNNAYTLIGAFLISQNEEVLDISKVSLPNIWQFLIFTTLATLMLILLYRHNQLNFSASSNERT